MDELEKLRKHWEDDNFQRKHALAREISATKKEKEFISVIPD